MANQDILLLKKDTGTDVTYFPVSDRPVLQWRTNVSGVSDLGQSRLEIKEELMKSGVKRVNIKIEQPIMEVIPSGSVNAMGVQAGPHVAGSDSISITGYFSSRGTNITRADLLRQAAQLLAGAGSATGLNIIVNSTADTYKSAGAANVVPFGLVNGLWPN